MTSTSSTGQGVQAVSLEQMASARKILEVQLALNQWLLVAPDGRTWQGSPQELLHVLGPVTYPRLKAVKP